jgi:DhnA family fructose-bisphosphate aldolase class Ia
VSTAVSGEGGQARGREDRPTGTLKPPALILAADHRGRGVMTIEDHHLYLEALRAALPHCDGILATVKPLADLAAAGDIRADQHTYLSLNRTGLAGSAFELDDRLVATVGRAASDGWSGVKLMTRIDYTDPAGAAALSLLGQVIEEAGTAGLEALIEPVVWRDGRMSCATDDIVLAAVIAHDLGAPLLKVPVPDVPAGEARIAAVARVVASVGVPVLFLGGPHRQEAGDRLLDEVADVMNGGAAGLAIGRTVYQDPAPSTVAKRLAEVVHGR